MNVTQFNAEVKAFATGLVPEQVRVLQKKVALEGLVRLVNRTPVDTGRARGGWQVGVNNRPSGQTSPPLGPKHKKPLTSLPPLSASGQDTVNAGSAQIKTVPAFSVVYIVNNVEYIGELENGKSGQSPNGMLALTVNDLGEMFR